MDPDSKGEGEPKVLVLDGGADGVHVWVAHVQPLLGVLLGGQESDQVQRSDSRLSPENHLESQPRTKENMSFPLLPMLSIIVFIFCLIIVV